MAGTGMGGRPSMSSGLPTPGLSARRKSSGHAASPASSPSKQQRTMALSPGNSRANDDIAASMAALQAAIKAKDPAQYSLGNGHAHASLLNEQQYDHDLEALETINNEDGPMMLEYDGGSSNSGSVMGSPRRPRTVVGASGPALRKASQANLSRSATPTTPGGPGNTRPGSSLSSSSYASVRTPGQGLRPRISAVTPAASTSRRRSEAAGGLANSVARPSTSSQRSPKPSLELGDRVKALGYEGTLRYYGEVKFKDGIWGGIELSGEYAGKGKNDGSVQGTQYFTCPPNCGIFVQAAKIEPFMPPPSLPTTSSGNTTRAGSSSLSSSTATIGPTPRKVLPRPSLAPSTVTRQATKSSQEASESALGKLTAGSRASSYLNLTARELRERRGGKSAPTAEQESPSKSGSSNLTSSQTSTVAAGVTPRPIRTAGRPSIGTVGATPGARKSFGGPGTPTPASSIRRPPSSLRSHTPDIPSVPPIPSSLMHHASTGSKSSTGSTGIGAPTPGRRYSALTNSSSRPTTPSVSGRPSSRMSNVGMRSASRTSSRASMVSSASAHSSRLGLRPSSRLDDPDDDEVEHLSSAVLPTARSTVTQDLRDQLAKAVRESEQAKLELLETANDLKDERKKVRSLNAEIAELKRSAAASRLDEASAIDEKAEMKEMYEGRLSKLQAEFDSTKTELDTVMAKYTDLETGTTSNQSELVTLRAENVKYASENAALSKQVGQLKEAGQALVKVYEDRLADAELVRLQTEDQLRATEQEMLKERAEKQAALSASLMNFSNSPTNQDDPLGMAPGALSRNTSYHSTATNMDTNPDGRLVPTSDALLAASLSAGMSNDKDRESAIAIDNENLKLELEHTLKRLDKLEENLAETNYTHEVELEKEKKKRDDVVSLIEEYKREIRVLNDTIEQERQSKAKLSDRIKELETALKESNETLENERAELESFRNENSGSSTSHQDAAASITHLQANLAMAEKESSEKNKEISRLKAVVDSLQEEVRLMEDLRDEGDMSGTTKTGDLDDTAKADYEKTIAEKEEQILALRKQLSAAPSIPSQPTDTDTQLSAIVPASGEPQGVTSPDAHRTSTPVRTSSGTAPLVASSLSSHIRQMRSKRDSNNSVASDSPGATAKSGLKDEASLKNDEIEGMKFLVKQLTEERSDLVDQNRRLLDEAEALKDAQRELEKTVEGLMEQMDSQQSAASAATAQTQASSQPVDSSEAMTALQDKVQKYEAEIKALNQEVVELETLIETKIFREDELECKIVDLKKALEEALSGNPDVSKASKKAERATRETVKAADASRADRRTNGLSHDSNEAASDADLDDGNCELCGDAHKIEDCPIFGTAKSGDTSPILAAKVPGSSGAHGQEQDYCDDCEVYGHSLNDCPVAYEVF